MPLSLPAFIAHKRRHERGEMEGRGEVGAVERVKLRRHHAKSQKEPNVVQRLYSHVQQMAGEKRGLGLALLTLCLLLPHSARAAELRIVPRAEWHALDARPYKTQIPKRFTIHHSAVTFDPERDAAQHIADTQRWGMGEARNWADIPYHFIIAPTGVIFEGRDPRTEGESNTSYDTSGHLQINLLGNFNEQDPTDEQLESLVQLIAWAHTEFDIPTATIMAHRDFAATACPGDSLYRYVTAGFLRTEADKIIAATAKKPAPERARP